MSANNLIQKVVLVTIGLGIGYYAGLTTSKSGSTDNSTKATTETSQEAAKTAQKTTGRPLNNFKPKSYNPGQLIQPSTNAIGSNVATNRPNPKAIDRSEIITKLEARIAELKAKGGNEKEIERLEKGVANLKKIQERQNAARNNATQATGTVVQTTNNQPEKK
jgi:hypothetical protein